MGHAGQIYRDGLPYAYAAFYAITIPLAGVLFLKRQWLLGKRFGYLTPGEMLADYFGGEAIRILTVVVALFFAIPFVAIQLDISGSLLSLLTTTDDHPDGALDQTMSMWILSLILLAYVIAGGLRAVAYVDTLQCILLLVGIVIVGLIALDAVGGWNALQAGLAELAASDVGVHGTTGGRGGGDYNAYFAIPGAIQFTAGLGREEPVGGLWTGVMCLTYVLAFMGIQSAPAFSMWAFSSSTPRPFAPQQVWASAFAIGLILIVFTTIQGMAAHLLGANADVTEAGLAVADGIPVVQPDETVTLVAHYVDLIAKTSPWLVGLLAICALAAIQSTSAAYMSTTASMLARDIYKRHLAPAATHALQILLARLAVAVILVSALLLATISHDLTVRLGGLAVALGFQMCVPLAATCWLPWITRQGATWGLLSGILGVIATEDIGIAVLDWFGDWVGLHVGWGRWPWTIHSAGWGMILNLAVSVTVSALTQNEADIAHPHEVSRLSQRTRRSASGQKAARAVRLDHHGGVADVRRGAGRGHRQRHLRLAQRRPRRLDLWHAVHLGLADPVLAAGYGPDLVPRLRNGDVHNAGEGDQGARRGHHRNGARTA